MTDFAGSRLNQDMARQRLLIVSSIGETRITPWTALSLDLIVDQPQNPNLQRLNALRL